MKDKEQTVEQFLANIIPAQGNICWWQGCERAFKTHSTLVQPSGLKECFLCFEHFAETQRFVMNLERYHLPEESSLFQAAGMFEINESGWADKHDEYIADTLKEEL